MNSKDKPIRMMQFVPDLQVYKKPGKIMYLSEQIAGLTIKEIANTRLNFSLIKMQKVKLALHAVIASVLPQKVAAVVVLWQ